MSVTLIEKSKTRRDAIATLEKLKERESREIAQGTVRGIRLDGKTRLHTTRQQSNESIIEEHQTSYGEIRIRGSKG
jgi:hypothetical protein